MLIALAKFTTRNVSHCRWNSTRYVAINLFGRGWTRRGHWPSQVPQGAGLAGVEAPFPNLVRYRVGRGLRPHLSYISFCLWYFYQLGQQCIL